MPTLPAQTSDDTMSNARWQGYHQPYPEEGDFMMGTFVHSGDMLPTAPHRSEPTSEPLPLLGWPYNTPNRSGRSSAPSSLPGQHAIEPAQSLAPQAISLRSEKLFEPSSSPGQLTIAPSPPGRHTAAPSSCPLLDTLPAGMVDLLPDLASDLLHSLITGMTPPPPRPNTLCEHPIFDATDAPATLVCSPVGVVPKPRSNKRRTIYHLSHPRKPGTRLPSVNDGIATSFVTIHYESLDTIMDFIHEHPSASLWKADLEDAFRHIIVAESDARLMGIHFDASPSPTSHSDISHYLNDFFGASDTTASPTTPIQVLSLSAAALGFKLSHKKTFWETTKLEILGIELDSVAQTASITLPQCQHILQLCSHILEHGRASLLELQQVAGHLQFVTRSWDGVSLLQPSPLVIEHVWTDASKRYLGGHWGSIDCPSAVFTKELSRRHQQKDIRFLEALAVLEALHRFSPSWDGPCRVVIHVDNENVEYGLRKGSIRDPQTQVLFRAIFALCLQRHIDLVPVRVASAANVLADALSRRRFALIQQQYPRAFALLHFNTTSPPLPPPSAATPSRPQRPTSSSGPHLNTPLAKHMAPSSETLPLSSLGTSTLASPQPLSTPNAWPESREASSESLVILSPLPSLPSLCPSFTNSSVPSRHNRQMFCAAFCLAFACFLWSGELTWEVQGTHNMLTVGSVSFAADGSYATVTIPASKTDPFRQGATLTAPAVPLSTCAVSALRVVCGSQPPSSPLLLLDDDRPFDRSSFVATLRQCLTTCGVEPSAYSGHSFRCGAATWAASNGVDDATIRGLGCWWSDCFRRYINKSAADWATITKVALYTNTSAPCPSPPSPGATSDHPF
ncbi:hypothetical protein NDA18_002108 [Ustilago nuda]|nr:hypothetical protein NDA18_002108 [Ustilago nuda]